MEIKADLIKISKAFHLDADSLLKKSDLIRKLSKYGKVSITGSYDLDLMMDGDIDIFIINKEVDKKKSVVILRDLIMDGYFNGYLYFDWTKRKHEGFPKGYYIGLKTSVKDIKWKVDIWLIKDIYKPTEKLMNFVRTNLNETNKKIILDLKYKAKNKNLNLRSSDIYLKVLK